ncbi:MAG TPA: cysteine--tRNA ligase [Gemmatimonadaceae bacterium]|nr:cysteine--tRNA ligase [Gemmatimonadaceae bacterium]
MPEFRLYNSLTRSVEAFAPADGATVRLYTCGPTVYNPAHLGNFRTFLFEDLLRRALRMRGWGVEQVMNLTDVDDKIIKRAGERGLSITDLTNPVIETFHKDREYLRIQRAEHYPRATAYIAEMIDLVKRLEANGVAYRADDGSVYFAIDKFPAYGRLSRLDTREIRSGARVAQDDYAKENAQDFALWKAAKPEDEACGAAWDSPWGRGRPGWHLECSAMAMAILGETIDIHAGGIDLTFPHHEDEIAQSEAATGKPFARFWCHGEFLLTDGAKMAKRVGNVSTVADLREEGVSAAALRHFVFSTHYRKQLNLSGAALEASMEAVRRVGDFAERLERERTGPPALAEAADTLVIEATTALSDDLNAPRAIGALFEFIHAANRALDAGGTDPTVVARARDAFRQVNAVLDIVPDRGNEDAELAGWVESRLTERSDARARRDFVAADSIRKLLEEKGIAIEDGPSGTRWKKVR